MRYGALYGKAGSNINFVEQIGKHFSLPYRRGVKDETLAMEQERQQ
jgi:diaminopimelate epimerase